MTKTVLTEKDVETVCNSILQMVREAEKLQAERDALLAEGDRLRTTNAGLVQSLRAVLAKKWPTARKAGRAMTFSTRLAIKGAIYHATGEWG